MQYGEICASDGQLNEPAHLLQFFFGDPDEGIERVDLGRDAAVKSGCVKVGDGADAALRGQQLWPDLVGANPEMLCKTRPYTRYHDPRLLNGVAILP